MGRNSRYVSFNGKKYALNLEQLKKVCLFSGDDKLKEFEISQAYEADQTTGELVLSSKVEHETKTSGNPQNDMIVYDLVKLFVVSLLEDDVIEDEYEKTFGNTLAINTLLAWGILEEVE